MSKIRFILKDIAFRTAIIYVVAGSLWIAVSDSIVSLLSDNPDTLTHLQTYKGWFFVLLTTLLLYTILKKPIKNLAIESERRKRAEMEVREINLELENKVKLRTAQYEEANREMEAFIHAVNHELRAPLRTMKSYTDMLVEEAGDRLDENQHRILGIVTRNAAQMQQLIDDLHSLSTASKNNLRISEINMTAMAKAICHEVLLSTNKSIVEFVVNKLPDANADNTLIKQVWLNLISNAVKFSGKVEFPVIKISGEVLHNELIYKIQDNGVGFNPEYMDKLFGIFNRLHSKTDFEGTGVGLSLVRRIIHRHGGRVWADSKPDMGATFWFTLPVDLKPKDTYIIETN
jgi:light-regulated signal transduction histidine kinase (bacteriophytochrome)